MLTTFAATLTESHHCEPTECAGCLVKISPLEIQAGIIKITKNGFIIGRDSTCDLVVQDDSVSRKHAAIEIDKTVYTVQDLGSTNGVHVNDSPVDRCELKAGDRIRFGKHIFKFLDRIEAQFHETVYDMMTRDGLTGAYNKRYFLEALHRDVSRCRRHHRPMTLIMLDIDFFKKVNDKHGHLAGDEVLQELCQRLTQINRQDEILARFGGEEFAMIVSDGTRRDAEQMAERIRIEIEKEPFQTSAGPVSVSISAGVAQYDGESPANKLIEQADAKLYHAKQQGRNQVCS